MKSIFTRRSIRSFTDESVSKDTMEDIIRAGMQSPSAMNKQPWEFIVTNKQEDKNEWYNGLHQRGIERRKAHFAGIHHPGTPKG